MPAKIELDETLLVQLYQQGQSIYEIGDRFGCSGETIRTRLKSLGVKMRPRRQYQYKYSINESRFLEINDEESAYWLGFMYADGYCLKKVESFGSLLSVKDIGHLQKLKEWLAYTGPVYEYNSTSNFGTFGRAHLAITNRFVYSNLVAQGCVPNKTGITKPPNIQSRLYRHFIRGYFDGDGWITVGQQRGYKRVTVGLLADKELIEWIREVSPIKFSPARFKDGVWLIAADGSTKPLKFLDWLYQDATVYLDRKYDKYQEAQDLRG